MSAVAEPSSFPQDAAALARQGRLDEAERLARTRLNAAPDDAEAVQLLGGIARARGDRARAVELYSEALRLKPAFAKAHSNLGATLLEMGRVGEAIDHLSRALADEPDFVDARVNLGAALFNAGRFADAERELRAALQLAPDDTLALNTLGNALFRQGRVDEAIAAFETALAREPDLAMAINNLGTAWREKGEPIKAEQAFRRALSVQPDAPETWNHLGIILRDQGRYPEALAAHGRALRANPAFDPARFARSLIELGEGRFAEGFSDYRARPLREQGQVARDRLPDDLTGRRVLLLPNQGLGDELFFLRFAPLLKARGAVLAYRTGSALAAIVRRIATLDRVVSVDEPDPAHDVALSIGDLPHLLGVTAAADLPPPVELAAAEEDRATIAARLARLGPPPYVGLTWRAGTREWNALLKAVPVAALGRALSGLSATFLAVQRAPDAGEIATLADALGAPVHDLSDLNASLPEMLALLERIEAYAGVSNTNTHLCAGTRRIAHVLVPHPPEWRWMNAGGRSPWFPHFPVYRQQTGGAERGCAQRGWEGALAALARDLAAHIGAGGRR
ncbi:MAG TPA: tetratricopeptide repeat protein [Alphaproteobacteria bacterium]|nr:tetratricopeptide repeat protein [Alphaproteobacteria bacterium]